MKQSRRSITSKNISVAVFDLEGTLTAPPLKRASAKVEPSIWTSIAQSLGPDALSDEISIAKQWTRGKIKTPAEWARKSVKIHKQFNLKKKTFFQILKNETRPRAKIRSLVDYLRRKNVHTVIITGSFFEQAKILQKKTGISEIRGLCQYRWSGDHIDRAEIQNTDYEYKTQIVRSIAKEHGCKLDGVLFVCNGTNDIPLAKRAGIVLGVEPAQRLKPHCTAIFRGNRAYEIILRYLKEQELNGFVSFSASSRNPQEHSRESGFRR